MTNHKRIYLKNKPKLLNDKTINADNRKWFKEFFEFEEKKLKRSNGLAELDEPTYKTLNGYINRFRNVNKWFKNKSLKGMPKKKFEKELERVYEDLEEGRILNNNNKPFGDAESYYRKIFKSVPFELINRKEVAFKVIKYSKNNEKEVRFFEVEDFSKEVVDNAIEIRDKCLLQVLWDFGENVGAMLQTRKGVHWKRKETKEGVEYHLVLTKDILKRSRTPRTEINNYDKTVELLDKTLENLKDGELVFPIGLRRAEQLFDRIVKKINLKNVDGSKPTLKDIRSSMACDLLDKGWTTDEIKSRLGHKPSSKVLDCYLNYKALKKRKPKQKILNLNIQKLEEKIKELKENQRLKDKRIARLEKFYDDFSKLAERITDTQARTRKVQEELERVLKAKRKG